MAALAALMLLVGVSAGPFTAEGIADADLQRAQYRSCSQQYGPYSTQDRAWAVWQQARGQGYAVSDGVFICYDGYGARGYCFNVFYAC